jgi:hypothetical protein
LRMLQMSRHVVVTRSGPRLTCAERADRRSEQPYQHSPTGLRQPLPNGATRELTAITCGNSALSSYCPRNGNGLGPPPTLTTMRVRQFRHCSGALLVTLCSQRQFSVLSLCIQRGRSRKISFLKAARDGCAGFVPPNSDRGSELINWCGERCCNQDTW